MKTTQNEETSAKTQDFVSIAIWYYVISHVLSLQFNLAVISKDDTNSAGEKSEGEKDFFSSGSGSSAESSSSSDDNADSGSDDGQSSPRSGPDDERSPPLARSSEEEEDRESSEEEKETPTAADDDDSSSPAKDNRLDVSVTELTTQGATPCLFSLFLSNNLSLFKTSHWHTS